MSNTTIYIGLDDTDNHQSRGTGRLARQIAEELAGSFHVLGITRHQLLVDPRIPCTTNNSSAAICLLAKAASDLPALLKQVQSSILADFQPESDPGLCVTTDEKAQTLTTFGRRAQCDLITQAEARSQAAFRNVLLEGLGGSQDGVIGALAAVGLAASGEDGRYILVGRIRELTGLQPISALLAAGISQVCTSDGHPVKRGLVFSEKLRPARRGGQPVLFVERNNGHWLPLKLD